MLKIKFRERLLRAFAAIVRTVAPTMAVKCFTVWSSEDQGWYKDNAKEIARLFLPGVKREIKAIKKLKLNEDQLRRRVWSDGTCLLLLRQEDYSLYFLAKSEDEYDVVVGSGSADNIVKVFCANTPSVAYLKKWLSVAEETLVIKVIKEAPKIFNDLKMSDLRCVYQVELLKSYSKKENLKKAVNRAKEVIQEEGFMHNILFGDWQAEEKNLFDEAMEILVANDYDLSSCIADLESFHQDWFSTIRDRLSQSGSSHLASYLVARLPKVWYVVDTNSISSFKKYYGYNLTPKEDASTWMALVSAHLKDPDVANKALEVCSYLTYPNPDEVVVNMQKALVKGAKEFGIIKSALKKLPKQYRSELLSKLYKSISSYNEASEAMKILPHSYRKGLRAKLVEMTCQTDAEVLIKTYWPFTNWEAENAEAAVRKLASFKKLPFDRLGELTEDLKNAALEEVDIVAEIETLCVGSSEHSGPGDAQQKLLERQLHPRSEAVFFCQGYHWQEQKLQYISKFEMSEIAFKALVNHKGGDSQDEERARTLISKHAEKWGLTDDEYFALIRSPYYSDLAAPLKFCPRTEPET